MYCDDDCAALFFLLILSLNIECLVLQLSVIVFEVYWLQCVAVCCSVLQWVAVGCLKCIVSVVASEIMLHCGPLVETLWFEIFTNIWM